MFAVRASDLIPAGGGLFQYDDFSTFFILTEDLVLGSRSRTQAQRIPFGRYLVDLSVCDLCDHVYLRCHGSRYGYT